MRKDNFYYYNPGKLLSGKKALESLPYELRSFGCKKPAVFCFNDDRDIGRDKIIIKSFYNSDITTGFITEDITDEDIDDIQQLFIHKGFDSIICIGTRAANIGKLLKIALDSGEKISSLPDSFKFSRRKTIPLIVVPAGIPGTDIYSNTAYSGERLFTSEYLFPDVICIDPRMTVSKNLNQGVFSAFEAFALSMESLMSSGNPFTASNTGIAVKFINRYLPLYMKKPGDKVASFGLCNGMIFAAMGISNSPKGLFHYLSLAYEKISGEKSIRFTTQIFTAIFEYYLKERKPDPSKLFLSLTGPDIAASVPSENKLKEIRKIVQDMISYVERSRGETPPEIIMFPDYIKAIESKASLMAGKSISKKEFDRILTDAFS
jgi:alcohol dehydrogenase